jgi:hypothetical protein
MGAGFSFSSYQLLSSNSPVLLTLDNYLRLLQGVIAQNPTTTYNVRLPLSLSLYV